jgi:hypothetical protein
VSRVRSALYGPLLNSVWFRFVLEGPGVGEMGFEPVSVVFPKTARKLYRGMDGVRGSAVRDDDSFPRGLVDSPYDDDEDGENKMFW